MTHSEALHKSAMAIYSRCEALQQENIKLTAERDNLKGMLKLVQQEQAEWISVPIELLSDALEDVRDCLQQHLLSYGGLYKAHRVADFNDRIAQMEAMLAAAPKGDKP